MGARARFDRDLHKSRTHPRALVTCCCQNAGGGGGECVRVVVVVVADDVQTRLRTHIFRISD